MPNAIKDNAALGVRAERLVINTLRAAGFKVHDLNQFSKNFPLVDLAACLHPTKALIQVRATTNKHRMVRISLDAANKLYDFEQIIGQPCLWAFVHIEGDCFDIRFGDALSVADIAFETEIHGVYKGVIYMDYVAWMTVDELKASYLFNEDWDKD